MEYFGNFGFRYNDHNETILGVPVLGSSLLSYKTSDTNVFIAVGEGRPDMSLV